MKIPFCPSGRSFRSAALVLTLAACGAAPAPAPSKSFAELGIANGSSPMPAVHCSGQPTEAQFDALPSAGITDVISLRPANEPGTGWEEQRAAALGLRLVRIPVSGAADLTDDKVRALDEALRASGGATLVCCGSSNRVGALMALRARSIEKRSAEESLAIGKACGLTKLEPQVTELLRR